MRVESRIPGADCNAYIAFAAIIAAGLDGIDRELDCGDPYLGNGYTATDVERIPWNLPEAIQLFDDSTFARDSLGEDVHFHLLHSARQEWKAFNNVVTEWELRRNFERI
jgi:glutamine synthetase